MEGLVTVGNIENFWQGKRVFITGHTGFKGMWLSKMLVMLGADVTGFSLAAPTSEGGEVLKNIGVLENIKSYLGDVRDLDALKKAFSEIKPEIVFHLAAQPLVLESYKKPVDTYATNVMGTVNILECVRLTPSVRSFLNVTTDKVYENKEWAWGYRENEPLDGFDPYSNSKSCSELVTHSYKKSFFAGGRCAISTARAGNVIGGGDFAENRIIPDCVRAAISKKAIEVRNPNSVRPYQHVLEPLYAYLLIAKSQYEDIEKADYYNVGPNETDAVTTGHIVELFCKSWGEGLAWRDLSQQNKNKPHEANYLKLDCSKIKSKLNWQPNWNIETAIAKTVEWAKAYQGNQADIKSVMEKQIKDFLKKV